MYKRKKKGNKKVTPIEFKKFQNKILVQMKTFDI